MTTKVVNVEDTMPYVEVKTSGEVFAESLREAAEMYRESAAYYRDKKEWSYATIETDIANELMRIAKTKDPELEMTWANRNAAYKLTEIRDAARMAQSEVRRMNDRNKK